MSIVDTDFSELSKSLNGWKQIYTGINAPGWPAVQPDDTTAWGELSIYHRRSEGSLSPALENSPTLVPATEHDTAVATEVDPRGSPIDSAFADSIIQQDDGDTATESDMKDLVERISALEAGYRELETIVRDLRTSAWVREDRNKWLRIEGQSVPIIITHPPSTETARVPGSFAVSPCSSVHSLRTAMSHISTNRSDIFVDCVSAPVSPLVLAEEDAAGQGDLAKDEFQLAVNTRQVQGEGQVTEKLVTHVFEADKASTALKGLIQACGGDGKFVLPKRYLKDTVCGLADLAKAFEASVDDFDQTFTALEFTWHEMNETSRRDILKVLDTLADELEKVRPCTDSEQYGEYASSPKASPS